MQRMQRGYTFIEMVVVMGVVAATIAFATLNLVSVQQRAPLTASVNTILADVAAQQARAMVGDTAGSGTPGAYGVRFEADRYVLFRGAAFNAGDTANVSVMLEIPLTFTDVLLPNQSIVFAKGSGEFSGYAPGAASVTLKHAQSNERVTLQFNKFGVVTSIN